MKIVIAYTRIRLSLLSFKLNYSYIATTLTSRIDGDVGVIRGVGSLCRK